MTNNFYSENVKNMVNNLIKTADFNRIKAIENLEKVLDRVELTKIKYEDYVEDEYKGFWEEDYNCRFNTRHWNIVNWIINEGNAKFLTSKMQMMKMQLLWHYLMQRSVINIMKILEMQNHGSKQQK